MPANTTDAIYGVWNLVPVLTLCAVVYAAGTLTQRVKAMEAEIKRLRYRVHKLANYITAASGQAALADDGGGEDTEP